MFKVLRLIFLPFLLFFSAHLIAANDFIRQNDRYPTSNQHSYLGIRIPLAYSPIAFNIRCPIDKFPGDYFYSPMNADTVALDSSIRAEIRSILASFVDSSYFSNDMISFLKGYTYRLCEECTRRNEYHIRYSCGDTLYVISGWIGKFISFYRAVPGDSKLSMGQLQNEIARLSPSYQIADSAAFVVKDTRSGYFCERVDRQNMMRVRNYTITEIPGPKSKHDLNQAWTYNLIEITKFIDKEMLP